MDEFPEPRRTLLAHGAVIAGLLVAISAPAADLAINGADVDSVKRERRSPAPFPSLGFSASALSAFPRGFDRWFQDAFGLRDVLIRMHNRIAVFSLGSSPIDTLLIGKDGWIFHLEQKAMESFRGLEPFEDWELEHWRRVLELRRDFVESLGAEYVVTHLPSKLEVYDHLVPERFVRVGPSRRAQLLAHMREHSNVRMVDVLPALKAEVAFDRPDRHVYYPHGVHWTDSGAAAAYRVLIDSLDDTPLSTDPLGREAFETLSDVGHRDSWAGRLHLEGEIKDQESGLRRIGGWRAEMKREKHARFRRDRHYLQPESSLPTAVLLHDSMGPWILPFMAEHFSRLEGVRRLYFPPEVLAEIKPDVVFDAIGERPLATRWPVGPTLAIQDRLERAFEKATDVRLLVDLNRELHLEPGMEQAVLSRLDGALEIAVEAGGNAVALPPFDATMPKSAGEFLLLKLDIEEPGESQIDVNYRFAVDGPVDVLNSYTVEGQQGRNVVYIPLSNPRMVGTGVLLRVGRTRGRYVLRHVEIRAVTDE